MYFRGFCVTLSFDAIASQFDSQRGLPREAMSAWIGLIHELAAGRTLGIIEPGIGTGRITLPLAALGHHITGTDLSAPMLRTCRERAQRLNLSAQIELAEADATDLPCGDHAFDLGVIAQLLYLVPDWPTVLDELARVVKPGGFVIHLTEPTIESNALAKWSANWRQIIEATGYRHTELTPSDDDIHVEFVRRWPDVQVRELASWCFGQSVEDALDGYADRIRPLYEDVPEAEFDRAVERFLTEVRADFPDRTTRLDGTVRLSALIAST